MFYTDNLATQGLGPGFTSPWSVATLGVWELKSPNVLECLETGNDTALVTGEVYKGAVIRPREMAWLMEIALLHGLYGKLTVGDASRVNGDLFQSITDTTISTVLHSTAPYETDAITKLAQVHGLVDPLTVVNTTPDVVQRSAGPLLQNIIQFGTSISVENA